MQSLMTAKFIGYTNGLVCTPPQGFFSKRRMIYRVEKIRLEDGRVRLEALRENLSCTGICAYLTAEQYDARQRDDYNDTVEAQWALRLLGFTFEN